MKTSVLSTICMTCLVLLVATCGDPMSRTIPSQDAIVVDCQFTSGCNHRPGKNPECSGPGKGSTRFVIHREATPNTTQIERYVSYFFCGIDCAEVFDRKVTGTTEIFDGSSRLEINRSNWSAKAETRTRFTEGWGKSTFSGQCVAGAAY